MLSIIPENWLRGFNVVAAGSFQQPQYLTLEKATGRRANKRSFRLGGGKDPILDHCAKIFANLSALNRARLSKYKNARVHQFVSPASSNNSNKIPLIHNSFYVDLVYTNAKHMALFECHHRNMPVCRLINDGSMIEKDIGPIRLWCFCGQYTLAILETFQRRR